MSETQKFGSPMGEFSLTIRSREEQACADFRENAHRRLSPSSYGRSSDYARVGPIKRRLATVPSVTGSWNEDAKLLAQMFEGPVARDIGIRDPLRESMHDWLKRRSEKRPRPSVPMIDPVQVDVLHEQFAGRMQRDEQGRFAGIDRDHNAPDVVPRTLHIKVGGYACVGTIEDIRFDDEPELPSVDHYALSRGFNASFGMTIPMELAPFPDFTSAVIGRPLTPHEQRLLELTEDERTTVYKMVDRELAVYRTGRYDDVRFFPHDPLSRFTGPRRRQLRALARHEARMLELYALAHEMVQRLDAMGLAAP